MSTKEQIKTHRGAARYAGSLNLRTPLLEPTHGQAFAKVIEFNSDDVLQVEHRALYPALHHTDAPAS